MNVLYEDNHLLALDKPAGIATQAAEGEERSLEADAKAWLKKKYGKPGNVFLGVAHRLDKAVNGIVLFAKTSKSLSRLNAALRDKAWKKVYYALVKGPLTHEAGSLEHYLRHDSRRATVSTKGDPKAKYARLHYRVVHQSGAIACLEIVLETGRYHQIRCQLAAAGFPILGDVKYGGPPYAALAPGQIALHHGRLELRHPITGEQLLIDSPLPSAFTARSSLPQP